MSSASGPEHAYSPQSHDPKLETGAPENGANENALPHNPWWRLGASRWAALIALAALLGTTTVHAFTAPRELQLPPDFDEKMEKLALMIMLMPCPHREPDTPIAIARLASADLND
jgi:hypothetical protein